MKKTPKHPTTDALSQEDPLALIDKVTGQINDALGQTTDIHMRPHAKPHTFKIQLEAFKHATEGLKPGHVTKVRHAIEKGDLDSFNPDRDKLENTALRKYVDYQIREIREELKKPPTR